MARSNFHQLWDAAMPVKVYSVSVDEAMCKQCGICVEFCPLKVLSAKNDGNIEVVKQDTCSGCLFCELLCPELAINIRASE